MEIMPIIIMVAGVCNLVLAFLIYKNDSEKSLNRWYGIFGCITGVWVFSNYFIGIFSTTFWIKTVYAIGALVPVSALMWVLYFNEGKIARIKKVFLGGLGLIFFIVPFIDKLFLFDIKRVYLGGVEGSYGPAFYIYILYMFGALSYIVYEFFLKYRRSDGLQKIQTKFVLIGAIMWISLVLIIDFILPLFGIYKFIPLDSPSSLVFLVLTAYAIAKHQLFNIRVIAAELFTFSLWVILFTKIFLSDTLQDYLINIGIFSAVAVVGILLVRSVLKEVSQKEKMEQMAKDIERAYQVERKANEELKALSNVKNQFLMTVQHHLRTPLTAMRGYSDLLLGGTYGKLSKKVTEVVKKFEISTIDLIEMVNNFLDVTQFQMGKGVIALKNDVDLVKITEKIVEDLRLEAEGKEIYIKFEKPSANFLISADESKIKAALTNLIDNAIKYTKEGGVTVSLIFKDQSPKAAFIKIKDTGAGISKERLPNIFSTTFERTEDSKKQFASGKGIGLYLSSQIVQAHHGKIWVDSDGEGKGSTFFIELPVSSQSEKLSG